MSEEIKIMDNISESLMRIIETDKQYYESRARTMQGLLELVTNISYELKKMTPPDDPDTDKNSH